MGIESSFNFPSDLNSSYPIGTDFRREGDNHLRGIKSVLKTTFPNIDGAMTASDEELSVLAGLGVNWGIVPQGGIIMWSGSIASVPTGYALCDGTSSTPDLRDKFVVGAKEDDAGVAKSNITGSLLHTGGSNSPTGTAVSSGGHVHAVTVDNHTLTLSEIPPHSHTLQRSVNDGLQGSVVDTANSPSGNVTTSSAGGGAGHSHTASTATDGAHTHSVTVEPPSFYALAFIMKT